MGERLLLGQTYRLAIPVDDGAEPPATPTPLDPASLTVTVRTSAGTAIVTHLIGALTKLATGSYLDLITTGAGKMLPAGDTYTVEVRTTGPDSIAVDWLDVVDAPPGVINLAGAKAQLDKSEARRANDAELQLFVDAVNDWITRRCGAVLPRTVVDLVVPSPGTGVVWLPQTPVLAVVSATYNGVTVDVSGWPAPTSYGRLLLPVGRYPTPYPGSGAGLIIIYRVGRVPVPATLPLGARMLVQHLWRTQRTQTVAAVPGGFSDETVTVAGVGYAIPNQVAELVQPYSDDDAVIA